jgi:cysteinyl-tRNA synthetase
MDGAQAGLRRLLDRYASARTGPGQRPGPAAAGHLEAFDRAMADDLNTPRALAAVIAASRDDRLTGPDLTALAGQFDQVLAIGLTDLSPTDLDLKQRETTITNAEVADLIAKRNQARAAKDFAAADRIRDQLTSSGVAVEDHTDGESTWRWTMPSSG